MNVLRGASVEVDNYVLGGPGGPGCCSTVLICTGGYQHVLINVLGGLTNLFCQVRLVM